MMDDKQLKDHTFKRNKALDEDQDYHKADWREMSDFVLGARGRFLPDEGDGVTSYRKRNERLYNPVAKASANTLMAGMMAGITSPARPWFKLGTPDPELEEFAPVKTWLDDVQKILLTVFARSNFYKSMQNIYLELGTFGNACMGAYEDFDTVVRYEPYTIGGYKLGMNGKRQVDTMYREYRMSVGAMAKRFGKERLSRSARNMLDKNQETKLTVLHAIEPNIGRDFESPLGRDMPWRSVYYEKNHDGDNYLGFSGFNEKAFMAPRWSVVDEDTYASSYPGLDSLATNKGLQINELDMAIAVEKMHNPPLLGDALLRNSGVDLIAGGLTYMPNMLAGGKPGLAPVYEVNPRVSELDARIARQEDVIEHFFYTDLFLMVTEMDRAQVTATEIAERKEEKMLMLGPVLESLNNELLDPNIDRTFSMAQRGKILPPAPPDLDNVELKVEYIGVLAQAQKAISTAAIESTVAFAGNVALTWPEARHKIDPHQAIDEYAKAKGASPKILRTDDEAENLAAQEQQMMAAQAAVDAAPGMAGAAQAASETDVGAEDSLLSALTGA